MCQQIGDYEPVTLLHTLYKCPKAQGTIKYICQKLTKQTNILPNEVILTNARCTAKLGTKLKETKSIQIALFLQLLMTTLLH